jgi:ATPase family protein associated with various cellular activities (AAA)/winged helix domain-containing protein
MSRTGRWVAVPRPQLVELIDLLGANPNRALPVTGEIAFVGRELWWLDGRRLGRCAPEDLRELAPAHANADGEPRAIVPGYGANAVDAAIAGEPVLRASARGDAWQVGPLAGVVDGETAVAVHGQRTFVTRRESLRAVDRHGTELWRAKAGGEVVAASVLFGGRALAVLVNGGDEGHHVRVLQATGALIHDIALPGVVQWAVAEELGHAFAIRDDGQLARIDLRYGRVAEVVTPPIAARDVAVDQDGRHLVLASADNIIHVVVGELFRGGAKPAPEEPAEEPEQAHSLTNGTPVLEEPTVDAAAGEAPAPEVAAPAPVVAIPDALPLALGPAPPAAPQLDPGESWYASARDHLDALLDVVASRTALAIADAWNSGRLSHRDKTHRPYELEVSALIGGGGGFAADQLLEAKAQVDARQREAARRAQASAARGIRLPFPELAREVGLSAVAAQVLLLIAAPALRGEITRLYGVLSNDPHRPVVDRFLIEQIVAGGKTQLRDQIARELAPDAPLVRHGLVQVDPGAPTSLFARLTVPDALLDRMRGLTPARTEDVSTVRGADRDLAELHIAASVKRDLVVALAEPRSADAPLRLVIRGRRGSGRHTAIAAVARRIQREIAAIDVARMPRGARELAATLRGALFRASVHGLVPVLSGLEQIDMQDNDLRELVRQVLRVHPGPLVVRTSPESTLPLDPGYDSLTLPPLSETERGAAWAHLLAGAGLRADADALAARYRIGPGTIARVVDQTRSRVLARPAPFGGPGGRTAPQIDATAALDEQVRQHVATRLDHVAARLGRLASWEDIALPDEMLDSLREFIARARYRRTVFEQWGYDAKLSTSRGLTALFYGPPGTGKTMVAGVIARELGLDVYRVDLARVVSKWVGETEKNLAEVFDGAEDGQVLILFDEADSLFAKRTDVRTSNDRYANLEVNYLLQRLDSFEGVAILTSNLDGAIDPAFKRRLSLRMQFPFPDEDMRLRLWAAHVTPQTPTAGDFDFGDLARRFPLSGGYIRNCVVRAAFLAAHEGRPLAQNHLLRAIQLEYRELGKLSTSSRME